MTDTRTRPLQRRLLRTFAALGLLGLLVVGVTGYTLVQWQATEDTLSRHYLRSLRLQEVRALAFDSLTQVPAAVRGEPDATAEYDESRAPLGRAFAEWADLAEDDGERAEVAAVRDAATRLDEGARRVLDLVATGEAEQATTALAEVEATLVEPFESLTAAAVETDREKRRELRADADAARRTATLTLALAGAGVVSLLLLVGAYLSGGVFAPVRRLHDALRGLDRGETGTRLPVDGDDEIAEVNRAFNALAERLATEHSPAQRVPGTPQEDATLLLRRMIAALRTDTTALADGAAPALLARIDAVEATLDRLGSLAYPVDLRPVPVEPAALLHEVLDRVADEVVRRSVSTDVEVDPDAGPLPLDRARVREAVGELVRNALDALPGRGGRLRLRAVRADDEPGTVALEVEDDGAGLSEDDVAWLYDGGPRPSASRGTGLRLVASVVEQHGGRLQLRTVPGGGTTARLLLPRTTPVPPLPEETR
ncbi:Signal transduction histidine kinase [Geodermatophilus dictyosporus]|uniref:Signal transduction histidine-protein kinase/phosphatase MprB n=1 Tax=Geodermatophilus dictyosporus TaxID=1523247 RepID=A0A1I5R2V2_9ACTN|nr:HAMP domain-containing sensor histidine kinase [Geodermatophilus dictyosporus]SFP52884.1 Signal transduction histidine kinase [Geodermatophilus dictyosporus]